MDGPSNITQSRFGRYQIRSELGRGGMGVVYRAFDPTLHRDVAIKVILKAGASENDVQRFVREARSNAKVRHRGIVGVHGAGEQDGRPFIVMDFVEGSTLSERLRDGLEQSAALGAVRQAAEAVAFAHGHGVIHRDLKPANLMVSDEGVVKIMDFGLALELDESVRLTQAGLLVGSPEYMSPEQAEDDRELLGTPTDVYALGSILYRIVCGVPPYRGSSALTTLTKILTSDPTPPRELAEDLSEELEELILRCLSRDPAERPTAAELADALADIVGDAPAAALVQPSPKGSTVTQPTPTPTLELPPDAPAAETSPPPKKRRAPRRTGARPIARPSSTPTGPIIAGIVALVIPAIALAAWAALGTADVPEGDPTARSATSEPEPEPAPVPETNPDPEPDPDPDPDPVPKPPDPVPKPPDLVPDPPEPEPVEDLPPIVYELKNRSVPGRFEVGFEGPAGWARNKKNEVVRAVAGDHGSILIRLTFDRAPTRVDLLGNVPNVPQKNGPRPKGCILQIEVNREVIHERLELGKGGQIPLDHGRWHEGINTIRITRVPGGGFSAYWLNRVQVVFQEDDTD